jgi:cell division transport system ATP-binding protein
VIIALDLCLRHGNHEIIDGLNLHVEKGEFAFICGQAGSGKSTLLQVIALERRPAGGRIIVDGRDIMEIKRREIPHYRRQLGLIFQGDRLLPNRTLTENVSLSLEIIGWASEEAKREADYYLGEMGLLARGALYPDQASENEKQLIKICRGLARRPTIVLADEPFERLDAKSVAKTVELFTEANLRGSTIVATTHNVELVNRLGKRAIMLDRSSSARMVAGSASV